MSTETKTPQAIANCMCAICGRRPDNVNPLTPGWTWDTMEPTNNWLWCPDHAGKGETMSQSMILGNKSERNEPT